MRRTPALVLTAVVALASSPAAADDAMSDRCITKLSLGATATRTVSADEYVANLTAMAKGETASAVQTDVNQDMAQTVAMAREAGLRVHTGTYSVREHKEPKRKAVYGEREYDIVWRASQTATLTATDAAALIDVVGSLQNHGLTLQGLHPAVSRDLREKTSRDLNREALVTMRTDAESYADVLGLAFSGFDMITVEPQSAPRPYRMEHAMMADSMSAAPPVMGDEDSDITTRVKGTALLRDPSCTEK